MDATPFSFGQPPLTPILSASGRPLFGQATASLMSMKWSALHDAAAAVAAIAGLAAETMRPEVRNFPAMMRDAGGWRRELAEQGIEDLSAIMEPGLAALLAAHARGMDASAPALALWQEFHTARNALLELMPPPASSGPLRSA